MWWRKRFGVPYLFSPGFKQEKFKKLILSHTNAILKNEELKLASFYYRTVINYFRNNFSFTILVNLGPDTIAVPVKFIGKTHLYKQRLFI